MTTYVVQKLEDATNELNSMLDARFQIPIPKQFFYKETTPDWDYVIKKATCYIAGATIMRADNPLSEEADALMAKVIKEDETGIVERINSGKIRLRCEID